MSGLRESISVVLFGLALVLAMATMLFALMGLNPKSETYGWLPWVYSGLSLVGSAICWRVSSRLSTEPPAS